MELAAGGPLDRDVEDLITAFGNGLMVLLAIWLVLNDLQTLGAHMLQQQTAAPTAAVATLLLRR